MSELRYQMDVYFESMPEIDAKGLAEFVNGVDPDVTDKCEVSVLGPDELNKQGINPPNGITITGFTVAQGPFAIMGLVHSVPSPGADIIETCNLPDEAKKQLVEHKSFALLTCFGGDDLAPVEKIVFLYKVGMGLCAPGALGIGLPHSGICAYSYLLKSILEKSATIPSPDDKPMTLWRCMREEGEPAQFLVDYVWLPPEMLSPDAKGGMVLLTRGFSHLGFADLMYHAETEKEGAAMQEFFQAGYEGYLFPNRPILEAGHTLGDDSGKGPVFRLAEPPDTFKPPFETFNVLLVTREDKPKKKLFGIFG